MYHVHACKGWEGMMGCNLIAQPFGFASELCSKNLVHPLLLAIVPIWDLPNLS